ncbi:hypothetical protein [Legionella maioricensis]|uniref:Uncharacterized protein n=1 Tax=Legionella maioricensis TaxID=2896528 RepID=A0A9X2D3Q1_9GAMM|nr:hypothetical protein [Legionella maioricensis]MCL9685485.1 hypothetical protein [Legionella maioricensis]MCL9688807.1 hypothetical protein [Legionella maioricensis]
MTFLFASALVIPGYESLSEETRTIFENSLPGRKFSQVAQSILTSSEELRTSSRFWHSFTGTAEQKKQAFQSQLNTQKKELMDDISEMDEYKTLVIHMTHALLEREIDEFQLLTKNQQQALSRTEFSKKLFTTLAQLDSQIEKERQEQDELSLWSRISGSGAALDVYINQLQTEREEAIQLWKTEFLQNPGLASFRETIEEQQKIIRQKQLEQKRIHLKEHATQLSVFFPLLNYRKFITEEPIIDQIRAKYWAAGETADPEKVDEELLTELLYFCMQQMNYIEIDFMNLDAFNKKHANRMAREILNSFNNNTHLDLDDWFKKYENKLHQQIIKQLQLINGKKWEVRQNGLTEDLLESLSYLWNSRAVNRANEFLRKMADAHGFIQATSFSTQNESSYLAILDVYNYARHQEQISEVRSVLSSLLSPLLPLYNEYKDIALYEKNPYWKSFRTIMPIVIIVAFIILVAVILAPLALPELAFTAAFVPALLIGLALATKYVSVKNDLYKKLRERYYGGAFEIPEFQVNARMLGAFGTMENASKVRTFYITGLKNCDDLEKEYSLKHEQGLLSQQDIDLRRENRTKRHQLCLEWYDIHSNNDLDFHRAPLIVSTRLQQNSEQEFQQLQNALQEERELIRQSVAEVTTDLKETIVSHNKMPAAIEQDAERESTTIKTNYRYGLFSPPRCLKLKAHIEELADFRAQISTVAVG